MWEFGCDMCDVNIKSDNEEALRVLVENIGGVRAAKGAGRMCVENSSVYCSKSNGVIERGIQAVQGQLRTMRSAVEEKLAVVLSVEDAIWTWMVEYAGWLLNRGEVGHDGKTAYERCKGKFAKILGIEFLEAVLWKRRPVGGPLGKLSCMWSDAVFLGVKGSTGEFIVGDGRRVWRTRTVQRKPEEERWTTEKLKMIGGVPWRTSEEDANMDGEAMKMTVKVMNKAYIAQKMEDEEFKDVVPRRFDIKKQDLDTHGYSKSCPGCLAILRKTARQGHSEGCQKRMREEMKGDKNVIAAGKNQGLPREGVGEGEEKVGGAEKCCGKG